MNPSVSSPADVVSVPIALPVSAVFPLALAFGLAVALGVNRGLEGDLLYLVSTTGGNLGDHPWMLILEGLLGVLVAGLLLGAAQGHTKGLNGISLGAALGVFWAVLSCWRVPESFGVALALVVLLPLGGLLACGLGRSLGHWLSPRPDVGRHLLGVDAPYWPLFAVLSFFQVKYTLIGVFHAVRAVHGPHWELTWDSGPGLVMMIFTVLSGLLAWAMIYWQYKLPRLPATNRFGGRFLHTRTILLAFSSAGLLYLVVAFGDAFLTL